MELLASQVQPERLLDLHTKEEAEAFVNHLRGVVDRFS